MGQGQHAQGNVGHGQDSFYMKLKRILEQFGGE